MTNLFDTQRFPAAAFGEPLECRQVRVRAEVPHVRRLAKPHSELDRAGIITRVHVYQHARSAIGMASLPLNAAVEVEGIIEVEG